MGASSMSRICPVVIRKTPQKIANCWAMSSEAKLTPNSIARYLVRWPASIRQAIQFMRPPEAKAERTNETLSAF